jgi:hypothetical protein
MGKENMTSREGRLIKDIHCSRIYPFRFGLIVSVEVEIEKWILNKFD